MDLDQVLDSRGSGSLGYDRINGMRYHQRQSQSTASINGFTDGNLTSYIDDMASLKKLPTSERTKETFLQAKALRNDLDTKSAYIDELEISLQDSRAETVVANAKINQLVKELKSSKKQSSEIEEYLLQTTEDLARQKDQALITIKDLRSQIAEFVTSVQSQDEEFTKWRILSEEEKRVWSMERQLLQNKLQLSERKVQDLLEVVRRRLVDEENNDTNKRPVSVCSLRPQSQQMSLRSRPDSVMSEASCNDLFTSNSAHSPVRNRNKDKTLADELNLSDVEDEDDTPRSFRNVSRLSYISSNSPATSPIKKITTPSEPLLGRSLSLRSVRAGKEGPLISEQSVVVRSRSCRTTNGQRAMVRFITPRQGIDTSLTSDGTTEISEEEQNMTPTITVCEPSGNLITTADGTSSMTKNITSSEEVHVSTLMIDSGMQTESIKVDPRLFGVKSDSLNKVGQSQSEAVDKPITYTKDETHVNLDDHVGYLSPVLESVIISDIKPDASHPKTPDKDEGQDKRTAAPSHSYTSTHSCMSSVDTYTSTISNLSTTKFSPFPIPKRNSSRSLLSLIDKHDSPRSIKSQLTPGRSNSRNRDEKHQLSSNGDARIRNSPKRRKRPIARLDPIYSVALENSPVVDERQSDGKSRQSLPCVSANDGQDTIDQSYDEPLINTLAATMLGNWMWKYGRKSSIFQRSSNRSSFSDVTHSRNVIRQKRWIRLIPEERCITWSTHQPNKQTEQASHHNARKCQSITFIPFLY